MKLLNLSADEGLDVIADLISPVCEIAEDKTASKIFESLEPKKGETVLMYWARKLKVALPKLIKDHKKSLIQIMAILNMQTEEEYLANKNTAGVIKDLFDLFNDEEIATLFTGAGTNEVE